MRRVRQRGLITAAVAALAFGQPATVMAQQADYGPQYIRAGRLIDGVSDVVQVNQCIVVVHGRIERIERCELVPRAMHVIDWSTYTVLPGLIDLHTHLADLGQSADLAAPIKASPAETALVGARNARVTLEAGFTSVRDVGTYRGLTDVALRNAIERGDVPGPRM